MRIIAEVTGPGTRPRRFHGIPFEAHTLDAGVSKFWNSEDYHRNHSVIFRYEERPANKSKTKYGVVVIPAGHQHRLLFFAEEVRIRDGRVIPAVHAVSELERIFTRRDNRVPDEEEV